MQDENCAAVAYGPAHQHNVISCRCEPGVFWPAATIAADWLLAWLPPYVVCI